MTEKACEHTNEEEGTVHGQRGLICHDCKTWVRFKKCERCLYPNAAELLKGRGFFCPMCGHITVARFKNSQVIRLSVVGQKPEDQDEEK